MLWTSITLSTLTRDVIFPSVSNKQGEVWKESGHWSKPCAVAEPWWEKWEDDDPADFSKPEHTPSDPQLIGQWTQLKIMKPNPSVAQWPWKVVEKIPLNVPLNNRICPCVCQWRQLFHFFRLLQWILSCVGELNMWMMHQVFIASMTSNDFTIYLLWKQ